MARSSGSDEINAYLKAVVRSHLEHSTESDAAFARKCGLTPGALNTIKNSGKGGGMRALESIARGLGRKPWDMYREALGGATWAPGAIPLRALPSWPEAVKVASQMADPKLVGEVGGFVPPTPALVVTALALVDLARGWAAIRAASADVAPESGQLPPEDDDLPLVAPPPEAAAKRRA